MTFVRDNKLILRFMGMNVGSGIAVGMINLILPIFALSLNANSAEIGLIKGITGVGDMLVVLPAGFLVDYFGSRKMYTFACISGALMIVVISFANSPMMLVWIMIVYGIVRSIRTTSLNADFFIHMNAIGIRKGGWFKGAMTIGSMFLGPTIGGIAIIYMGYQSFFVFTSMFLMVPLIVLYISSLYEEDPLEKNRIQYKKTSFLSTLPYYRELLKNRFLLSASLTEGVNSAFFITYTTFITILVVKDFGLAASVAAFLISIRGAAQILVVFFGGRVLYRNHNSLYVMSYGMIIFSLLLIGLSGSIPVIAIASLIIGIFSGILTIVTFTNAGSVEGEKGKIAGFFALGHSCGSIMGPVVGGMFAQVFDTQVMFLAFIPLFSLACLFYLTIGKKIHNTTLSPALA